MLTNNLLETLKAFLSKDEAFQFMGNIKGTPAYWKKFLCEVLSMAKQLGLPTFFMTLSCANLQSDELISIITSLRGKILTQEEIYHMDFFTRCTYLNQNPVLLARYFQHRVEMFFKVIVIDGPLGKVKYHAIRIEFQVRGSPHIHSFLWIHDAPILNIDNISTYVNFVDGIVVATLPDIVADPDLFDLVVTYQIHSHSKSCRKYKNDMCRYHFRKFFTEWTIVARPLPDTMSDETKKSYVQKR